MKKSVLPCTREASSTTMPTFRFPPNPSKKWVSMAVTVTAHTAKQQITKELADLRFRQLDESPEIKILDSAKTHARINQLLDELDHLAAGAADAAPTNPAGGVCHGNRRGCNCWAGNCVRYTT